MRVVWSDPYVWLHLTGIATVPILLILCFVGFAVGDPILPVWLEFFLVAAFGVAPILWMQWQRPFCIFSVVALALAPANISDPRRRMLRFFRTSLNQVLAIAVSVALTILLWQLYRFAPIAADVAPFSSRWLGLGMAAIAFFGVNLFTQVPVSVLRLLTVSDKQLAAQVPYPPERIPLDFVLFGIRLRHILPEPPVRTLPTPPAPRSTTPTAATPPEPASEPSEEATEPTPAAETTLTAEEPAIAPTAEVAEEPATEPLVEAAETPAEEVLVEVRDERSPAPSTEASEEMQPEAAEEFVAESSTQTESESESEARHSDESQENMNEPATDLSPGV